MKVKTFYELEVWQLAMDLAERTYKFCKKLPSEERFVLCDQMRRASTSIAFNIAEGQKRFSTKEFIRFLSIARGSLGEFLTQLMLCKRLGYLQEEDFYNTKKMCEKIDIKLYNLAKSLYQKIDRKKAVLTKTIYHGRNNLQHKQPTLEGGTNPTATAFHDDNVSRHKCSTIYNRNKTMK